VGLRVLVVDDDADVLELFAVALTACGAEVTTTDNARDAIALATRTRPHAIVSDIAMVGEDGYWLVRELKRLPPEMLGDVPVVAATAYGREHPRARVLAAGFTEHLQKPIDPEQLCRIVARVAGR
jgi:CheY-like chemotaxis protein